MYEETNKEGSNIQPIVFRFFVFLGASETSFLQHKKLICNYYATIMLV